MKIRKLQVVFVLSLVSLPLLLQAATSQKEGLVLGDNAEARSATSAITEQATQTPGDIYRGTVFGAEQKKYEGTVLGDRPLATKKLVYDTSLIRAIKINDADRVRTLMYANVSANEKNYAGITPLTVAGEKGNLDILKLLVENGKADVNDKSSYGVTPLIAAAAAGQSQAVSYLLEHGADAAAKDDLGKTALSYAAHFDDAKTIEQLLAKDKLSVNIPDNSGNTPLIYSAQRGLLNNVKIFLSAGAKVNYRNPTTGLCALSAAAAEGHLPVIRFLIKTGNADVNLRDLAGRTPIFYAVEKDQAQALQLLLSLGADPNVKDNAGVSPLMRASAKGRKDCQKILLRQKGIEVNAQDNLGRSVAAYSVYADNMDVVQNLFSAKADFNTQDLQGNTPLMNAIKAKNDRASVYLIQQGVTLTNVNQSGETAFTLTPKFLPNSSTARVLGVKQPGVEQQALQLEAEKLAVVRNLEQQLAAQEAAVNELQTQQEAQSPAPLQKEIVLETEIKELAEQPVEETKATVQAQATEKKAVAQTKTAAAKKKVSQKRRAAKSTVRTTAGVKGERIPKATVAPQEVSMADFLNQQ